MKYILILCSTLVLTNTWAQRVSPSIQVLSKVTSDGVWLRWAPAQFETWKSGLTNGYHIDRYTIQKDGSLASATPLRLTAKAFKPVSQQEFARLGTTQKETAAVGELIYSFQSNAPKDNSPGALLQQKEENEHRFGMALLLCDMSYKTAEASGLLFVDATAKKGERYIYKVFVNVTPEPFDPGISVVDVVDTPALKGFTDVAIRFGNLSATITWPTITHKGVYTAYIIERSTDNKMFTPVTDLPYMNLVNEDSMEDAHYVDSLEQNGRTYYYRVLGLTPFGDKSPASNVVSGEGKDDMTGTIIVTEAQLTSKKTSVVKWSFPSQLEPKIEGFHIALASRSQGPYKTITKKVLSKKERQFDVGSLASSCYVQIKVVDKSGLEISHSFPWFVHIEDHAPPAAPTGLKGALSTTGEVMLTWTPNTEPDIEGYRVFLSHSEKSEYVEVTRNILARPAFSEPVPVGELNKKLWFKVIAVDQSFNASPYSAAAALSLPDKIAPSAPVFTVAAADEKKIKIEWIPGTGTDLVRHTLERATREDPAWKKLRDFSFKDDPKFTDEKLSPGSIYRYRISAYDSSGNASSATSTDLAFGGGVKKSVTDFTAFINREQKLVKLTWKYQQPVKKVLIYRKKNDEKISLYEQLDGSTSNFEDKLIQINNRYTYRIQLVIDDDSKTELSDELKVQL